MGSTTARVDRLKEVSRIEGRREEEAKQGELEAVMVRRCIWVLGLAVILGCEQGEPAVPQTARRTTEVLSASHRTVPTGSLARPTMSPSISVDAASAGPSTGAAISSAEVRYEEIEWPEPAEAPRASETFCSDPVTVKYSREIERAAASMQPIVLRRCWDFSIVEVRRYPQRPATPTHRHGH
jgi:hypothetical protein